MSELNNIILERLNNVDLEEQGSLIEMIKSFAMDAIHDGYLQDLLFDDSSSLEEVMLESEASKRQDIGQKYWNAYFVPELGVIVQVTAINEQDAESTKDAYVKQQLEQLTLESK